MVKTDVRGVTRWCFWC